MTYVLEQEKETPNSLRWGCYTNDGTHFELYISQDRVPLPWPKRISVTIGFENLDRRLSDGISSTKLPIRVIARKYQEHGLTIQYRSVRPFPDAWALCRPYIPLDMLPADIPDEIYLEVKWDYSIGRWEVENEN